MWHFRQILPMVKNDTRASRSVPEEVSTMAPCAGKETRYQHESLPVSQPRGSRLQKAPPGGGQWFNHNEETTRHHLHSGCTAPVCPASRSSKPRYTQTWAPTETTPTDWQGALSSQQLLNENLNSSHRQVPRPNLDLQVY